VVYVDTAPATGAIDPGFDAAEKPTPSLEDLAKQENLDGLSEEQLETFRERSVPEPGSSLREGAQLSNEARRDIPSTVVATGYSSEEYKEAAKEGHAWLDGLNELRDVTWSTCRRATGRCGHVRTSSPRSSATSRRGHPSPSAAPPGRGARSGRGSPRRAWSGAARRAPSPWRRSCTARRRSRRSRGRDRRRAPPHARAH
jgi:hypothetical protein